MFPITTGFRSVSQGLVEKVGVCDSVHQISYLPFHSWEWRAVEAVKRRTQRPCGQHAERSSRLQTIDNVPVTATNSR